MVYTQFSLDGLFDVSSIKFAIFWYSIIILYYIILYYIILYYIILYYIILYYINLSSSRICFLSFGEIYLSLGISLLTSFECISLLCDFFDALVTSFGLDFAVILSAFLLPIKSPVASAVL